MAVPRCTRASSFLGLAWLRLAAGETSSVIFNGAGPVIPGTLAVASSTQEGETLPSVENVLSEVSQSFLNDFTEQADTARRQVAEKQAAIDTVMAARKAGLERRLAERDAELSWTRDQKEKLQTEVDSMRTANSEFAQTTDTMEKTNEAMRNALEELQDKLHVANDFVEKALNDDDAADDDAMKVLAPSSVAPSLSQFLQIAVDNDNLTHAPFTRNSTERALETSLVQVGVHASKFDVLPPLQSPDDVLQLLSRSLDNLDDAKQHGEARLEARFLAAMEMRESERAKLVAEVKELQSMRAQLEEQHTLLNNSSHEMVRIAKSLKGRLDGIVVFTTNLDAQLSEDLAKLEAVRV